ncbi:MAG: hypothetical protein KatS3mg029_0122 [Saprospiraceae bacterium]|nr:MAG: hypothetical protein KatS3mg029_0122 [Saprospiraceae bacterium]
MKQIYFIVEGSTEENFVKEVLKPHFLGMNIFLFPIKITTRKDKRRGRIFKGGLTNINQLIRDLENILNQYRNAPCVWVTTMVDLYKFPLPEDWKKDFYKISDGANKARFLESKLAEKFQKFPRFIPYVSVHEFEALLFSDLKVLHESLSEKVGGKSLDELRREVKKLTPEEINLGEDTAPSKRINKLYPGYLDQKSVFGPFTAASIGLQKIRASCPHFDEWLKRLESIDVNPSDP